METEKDLIMMYNTELRNVGLFTSLSLATLAYSRAHRGKGFGEGARRNFLGLFIAIAFMIVALTINRSLAVDLEVLSKEIDSELMLKRVGLLPFIAVFQVCILLFNFYTLFIEISKSR